MITTPNLKRRHLIGSVGAGLVSASCSTTNIPSLSSLFSAARYAYSGGDDVTLSRNQISKIPYASCYAKIGNNPRAFIVLSRAINDDLYWVSADKSVIVTKNGRIIKTYGFQSNLDRTQLRKKPNAIQLIASDSEAGIDSSRIVDINPEGLFNLLVTSRYRNQGRETLTLAEINFDLIRIEEHNEAIDIGWRFVNQYWADAATGYIWHSIQHISPNAPPITMTILKPAKLS